MGAGASSLVRLRKTLVMRAYNARKNDETFEEQFIQYSFRQGGVSMVKVEDIKSALSINADWVDGVFQHLISKENRESDPGECVLKYADFIAFLETGKIPSDPLNNPVSQLTHQHGEDADAMYRERENILHSKSSSNIKVDTNVKNIKEDDLIKPLNHQQVVVSKGLNLTKVKNTNKLGPPNGEQKPLWRKREMVRQERVVQYTTLDAEGVQQEILEKESTETEVMHMECRVTGEFVHRETTTYEQTETFNNELVNEQRGTEEYLHMKSTEDEFEYMDSTMPSKEPPPQPASPLADQQGQPGFRPEEASVADVQYATEPEDANGCPPANVMDMDMDDEAMREFYANYDKQPGYGPPSPPCARPATKPNPQFSDTSTPPYGGKPAPFYMAAEDLDGGGCGVSSDALTSPVHHRVKTSYDRNKLFESDTELDDPVAYAGVMDDGSIHIQVINEGNDGCPQRCNSDDETRLPNQPTSRDSHDNDDTSYLHEPAETAAHTSTHTCDVGDQSIVEEPGLDQTAEVENGSWATDID